MPCFLCTTEISGAKEPSDMRRAKLKSRALGKGEACMWGETGFEGSNKHKESRHT